MSGLLPCPFCGGPAHIRRSHDPDNMLHLSVMCGECGAESYSQWMHPGNDCPQTYEEVRERWNRRVPTEKGSAP
jgi:Lar family restriction alleviation protein